MVNIWQNIAGRLNRLRDGEVAGLTPSGETVPSVMALQGGGQTILGHDYPSWGHGGNVAPINAKRPTLLDLRAFDKDGMIWMPGLGFSTLDNSITTPFQTAMAGNVAGVAQRLFVEFDLVPNEYDPVASQSNAYIANLPNLRWLHLDETGYLTLRFRGHRPEDAPTDAFTSFVAPASVQWVPKQRLKGYYDLNPSNADLGGVWTLDFYVYDESSGTYEPYGDQIVGSVEVSSYKDVLTDQSGNPLPQFLYVGSGSSGQVYRGGLIYLSMRVGSLDATPLFELHADQWAVQGTATYVEGGRTWTLNNPQSDNFVTESCLASLGGTTEFITLTGSVDDPITPIQIATTRGLYPTLTASGFAWTASSSLARNQYQNNNVVVNTLVDPTESSVNATVTSSGDLVFGAPRIFQNSAQLATREYADSRATSAQSGAVSVANAYTQQVNDTLLAQLAGGIPFRSTDVLDVGDERIDNNLNWRLLEPNYGLPPMGIGDGSEADQRMVLSKVSTICASYGDGYWAGFGAEPTLLTNLSDSAVSPASGSLRKIANDAAAAWRADPTARHWVVPGPDIVADALAGDGAAYITLDDNVLPANAHFLRFVLRNAMFDFSALPGGLVLIGGGLPGPVPYCSLSAGVSVGAGATTILPTSSVADFGKTRLQVGVKVDVGSYVSGVWTRYGTNLTVVDVHYDNPGARPPTGGGYIEVSGNLTSPAPSGAKVILAMNPAHGSDHFEPGEIGCRIGVGGFSYSDMFGPGKPNIPAGNLGFRNIKLASNWGGDVIDTGDAKDFTVAYWADRVWLDHCSFSNPDPFHDTLFTVSSGVRGLGTTFCDFGPHYKAMNHFGGNAGTGGVSPDGTTPTPNEHPFPPIPGDPDGLSYDKDNPGPYDYAPGVPGSHGNPSGAPVVRITALHEYALFHDIGGRSPKNDHKGYVQILKSVIKNWGLPLPDPIIGLTTRFPLDADEGPLNPAALITNDEASTYYRDVSIYPHKNAAAGGLDAIKHTATGKSPAGYTRQVNVTHHAAEGTGGLAVSEPDFHPELVPEPPYPYVSEPESVYLPKVLNGAGAGTQSRMWEYVGPVTVTGGGSPASATESVEGIAKVATQTQTNTGTDDATFVTPLKFHTRMLAYIASLIGTGPTKIAAGDVPVRVDFSFPAGTATTYTGLYRVPIHEACTIASVKITSSTNPTGSPIIGDVQKGTGSGAATSIYATTTANRPTVATGTGMGTAGAADTTALAANDYLTASVLQVGSTAAGANILISVLLKRS